MTRVERAPVEALIGVRHAVLRKGRPVGTAHFEGDEEPSARHWVARLDQEVVGVVTVLARPWPDGAEGPAWQLRGMAVRDGLQGTGVGRALVERVADEVAAPMWCNARVTAEGFYARMGWQAVGERFDIAPIGPHVRMVWHG